RRIRGGATVASGLQAGLLKGGVQCSPGQWPRGLVFHVSPYCNPVGFSVPMVSDCQVSAGWGGLLPLERSSASLTPHLVLGLWLVSGFCCIVLPDDVELVRKASRLELLGS